VVTHVTDRDGRWQANFHGLKFDPINLVLYINALTHEHGRKGPPEESWWEQIRSLF
jgi:protein SCO1/2